MKLNPSEMTLALSLTLIPYPEAAGRYGHVCSSAGVRPPRRLFSFITRFETQLSFD